MELLDDLRYAVRDLRRRPASLAAILALALGIAANTSVFTVVKAVLFAPLPLRHPEELVSIYGLRTTGEQWPFNIPNFLDLRERNATFQDLAAYGGWNVNLTGEAEPERLLGARVTANYFEMMGVSPALGRLLTPVDDLPANSRVVVLTWGLWQRKYGGDRTIAGRAVRLNGNFYTVVGVLPAEFSFRTPKTEFAVPPAAESDPTRDVRASTSFLRVFGRMKPGVAVAQANANLDSVTAQLRRQYRELAEFAGNQVVPLRDDLTGASRPMLLVLMAAVALVLLITCANTGSLWVARAAARRKEFAVRSALGGTRARLVRQFTVESLLFSGVGGMLGVVLAVWGVRLLLAISPAGLPRAREIHIDGVVIAAGFGASLICGLLFGALPAAFALRGDVTEGLRGEARGTTAGGSRARLRGVLVVAEVAFSLMLLTGAGLLLQSFRNLAATDPGFATNDLVTVRLALPSTRYRDAATVARFDDEVRRRLQALPGVTAAGAVSILPLSGAFASIDFTIEGLPMMQGAQKPTTQYRMIDPSYFGAAGIPLIAGRNFTEADDAKSKKVVIVSQALAKVYWKDRDPIGMRVWMEDNAGAAREAEIVGVSGSVREMALDQPLTPCLFLPLNQIPQNVVRFVTNDMYWAVRARPGFAVAKAVRGQIHAVDGDVAAADTPMEQYLTTAIEPRRFGLRILGAFAIAALLLAAAGLYALVAYSTTQRTREIGVRVALGARWGHVAWLVVRQSLMLAGIGVAIGAAGAWMVVRYLSSVLFAVSPHDPVALCAAAGLMLAAAAAAAWFPARRAARIHPVEALRAE